jgi:hypothetical protein
MRTWFSNLMPEVLRNASIEVAARVARGVKRGGVDAVLVDIDRITSMSAKRSHYEALLRGPSLKAAEYDKIARHAGRSLATSPNDLSAVLTLLAASPSTGTKSLAAAVGKLVAAQETMAAALGTALGKNSSSSDSASTYQQYAATDDPEMIMMALRGVRDISNDTDKRVLLQAVAPKALGKKITALRTEFFYAAETISSDSDLRVVLQDALAHAHGDPDVTLGVIALVGANMTSDSDRRVTLTTVAERHLLTTSEIREAYSEAAKKITSSYDYRLTLQAALKR